MEVTAVGLRGTRRVGRLGAGTGTRLRIFTLGLFGCALVGCGGSGTPTAPPTTTTSSAPSAIDPNPSFASAIQPIFERRTCTNDACHGAVMSAGLDLRAGASYGNLVDTVATSEPIVRVIPGNPDGSYLVIKLEARQSVGTSMPLGLPPLSPNDLGLIRNWIAQGANDN